MQEKMRKELEQMQEAQETAEMTAEDARSAIPVKCSKHFILLGCRERARN